MWLSFATCDSPELYVTDLSYLWLTWAACESPELYVTHLSDTVYDSPELCGSPELCVIHLSYIYDLPELNVTLLSCMWLTLATFDSSELYVFHLSYSMCDSPELFPSPALPCTLSAPFQLHLGISNLGIVHFSRCNEPPWRNWLARSAVNRKVGGSSPPGGVRFTLRYIKNTVKNKSIGDLHLNINFS